MRFWPRSIRWQMLAGLVLLEALSIGLFAGFWSQQAVEELQDRTHAAPGQSGEFAGAAGQGSHQQNRPGWVGLAVKSEGESPNVAFAKVTDPAGNVLFVSKGEPELVTLDPAESGADPAAEKNQVKVFHLKNEAVGERGSDLHQRGFARVCVGGEQSARELMKSDSIVERLTIFFAVIWILASVAAGAACIARDHSPAGPVAPGNARTDECARQSGSFPLPVIVDNEFGDLIEAFNRMVASIEEQRSGLNDTLSLLDSMLANAPIGLAFFDRNCRIVRVNHVFAEMTGVPLSRHLGRTLPEVIPQVVAKQMEDAALRVFAIGESVRDLELSGQGGEPKTAVDLAGECLPGANFAERGALGGRDCDGCERAQTQRRCTAQVREAGRNGPSGRFHLARDQQSAGGDYEPAVSAAELLPA